MSIHFTTDNSTQLGGIFTSSSVYSGFIASNTLSNSLIPYDLIIDRSNSIIILSNVLQGNINNNLTTSSTYTNSFITNTSNILKGFIDTNSITSSNYTSNTSNILNTKINGNLTISRLMSTF